ncbi:MAG: hypothetical protein KDA41_02160 [Planctomycetales bacterium]|nr:hypothetical protein [Planctomycetales bacterium]
MINAYRKTLSLPAVPLSPSMTAVAALHAKDLAEQQPHKKHGSLHAWSDNTRWTGGNFLLDRPDSYNVMWQKPQEIAGYLGTGYEIAASGVRDADHALKVWQGSRPHLDVIANRGIWEELRWQALGAVYYKGFACAWFGEDKDE